MGKMNLVRKLLERLRPIVNFKSWDYCIIWQLAEDQRFLEWMDCCCAGSENIQNGGEDLFTVSSSVTHCRDVMFQHPRTKPCDLLAEFRPSIPLDSGIYAQALMSNQARWLNFSANNSDSNPLEETVGTRVLIPVPIGLVELFVAKQVKQFSLLICRHDMGRSESISDCSDANEDEDDAKYRRRTGKGPQSKNLQAERKRRKKLNDRLYTLRSLVPIITKLDRASILGDAIEFVKELLKQVSDLQLELEEQSGDDEGTENNGQSEILNAGLKREHENTLVGGNNMGAASYGSVAEPTNRKHDTDAYDHKSRQMEPQVEVAQIDENEFFVKVFCEHKSGGFVRLMEALNSLGLEVTNVNVTSCRSLVSNVFQVKKMDSEMVQADYVRDSLLEITRFGGWPAGSSG
ncbi:hypothetical protein RHSIM_Rhsim05G0054400 [Rhododendron simsii]|uniref:BHLH domain-containing protein n=1 Tax=Rhododendron simsii TaxID=118357 RepID=A0A834GZL7_RHOSS|nr:hypothetical protein RHSIM_Rhsim05G0054400 [Rhododendron simsii]